MGVIVSVTPKNTDIRFQAIKRLQKKQLVHDIVKSKGISITKFSDNLNQFSDTYDTTNLRHSL